MDKILKPLCNATLVGIMKNYPEFKPYDNCIACENKYGFHYTGKEQIYNNINNPKYDLQCRCWLELLIERQGLKEMDECLLCKKIISNHKNKVELLNEITNNENDPIALIKLQTISNDKEIDLKLIENFKTKNNNNNKELVNNQIKTNEAEKILIKKINNSVYSETNLSFESIIGFGKGKNIVYKVCNSKTKEIYACKIFENEADATYEYLCAFILNKSSFALKPVGSIIKITNSHNEKIETEQSAFLMPLISSPMINFFIDQLVLENIDTNSRFGIPEFMSIQMVKAMLDVALVAKYKGFAMCDMKPQNCGFIENDIKIYDFGGMTYREEEHPRESTELFIMDANKPDDIADLNTIAVSAAWSADVFLVERIGRRYTRETLKNLSSDRMKELTHIGWKIAYICTSNDNLEDCNELCQKEFNQYEI